MQITHLWVYLAFLQISGAGHDGLGVGQQALFCPAFPQPGVNFPDNWEQIYPTWLVKLQYVVHGNFSAQHRKMKISQDDVPLSDSLAYVVESTTYATHVSSAVEARERLTCQNHRAINASNASRKNLTATRIGATACARHGCFVSHSVVDSQKGEHQMNVDYPIYQALNYQSQGIHLSILAYDVACQGQINFLKQVQEDAYLQVPDGMDIVTAIRKLHLSAHKLECYP
ncbi:hypothetical protein PAXRUDRAFT_163385 [Paxillus rubicundulus Ve08.2h10]|uniref:Uncharacterized protein n=1 Tax=Paxillus rubicundulus Ve08.2h10 TaxID=930991 RepID=A0A0D0CTC9_9AGAM|nr:hypothetical protein PAXRUDRAFT_163385 [Paxillus rubicundulus Ve08.2h10]